MAFHINHQGKKCEITQGGGFPFTQTLTEWMKYSSAHL